MESSFDRDFSGLLLHILRDSCDYRVHEGIAVSECQEDQPGAVGLVVNAIVLWNTRYMDSAPHELRKEGMQVGDDDVKRLSPLGHEHINFLGRYQFNMPELPHNQLRALRDLNSQD